MLCHIVLVDPYHHVTTSCLASTPLLRAKPVKPVNVTKLPNSLNRFSLGRRFPALQTFHFRRLV